MGGPGKRAATGHRVLSRITNRQRAVMSQNGPLPTACQASDIRVNRYHDTPFDRATAELLERSLTGTGRSRQAPPSAAGSVMTPASPNWLLATARFDNCRGLSHPAGVPDHRHSLRRPCRAYPAIAASRSRLNQVILYPLSRHRYGVPSARPSRTPAPIFKSSNTHDHRTGTPYPQRFGV